MIAKKARVVIGSEHVSGHPIDAYRDYWTVAIEVGGHRFSLWSPPRVSKEEAMNIANSVAKSLKLKVKEIEWL